MDLQNLFYVIGIIFMVTVLGIIFGGALVIYLIRRKIAQIARMASKPAETAVGVGAGIVEGIALKVKDWTRSNRK